MTKIRISRDVLVRTRDRSILTDEEKATVERLLGQPNGKGSVRASVGELPLALLKALLDEPRLPASNRAAVAVHVYGLAANGLDAEKILHTTVASPMEFGATFAALGDKSANCELFINGRWYPLRMDIHFSSDPDDQLTKGVMLQGVLSLCEGTGGVSRFVYQDLFLDEGGQTKELTVVDVLNQLGLRRLQTPPAEFNLKLLRAERTARESGRVVLVSGPVIPSGDLCWRGPEARPLALPGQPRKAVVEPELEVAQEQRSYLAPYGHHRQAVSRLPFVRVFCLDTKGYGYADVDDLAPYEFDHEAMNKLHLPPDFLAVLTRVFATPVEGLFGDVIRDKNGGIVVLACGKPGVGKTLTAEVYAEETQRPLYVLEVGDLGTSVAHMELNLQRVFRRVAHWGAVLQFDEAEIFLAERGNDLERSAIVGVFLRLLDSYPGILFLTTNRGEVLDQAVRSRVMLTLEYPDLDQATRAAIWRTMLCSAGMTLTAGTVEELAEAPVNGRQIRNLTRLAKILYPAGHVTLEQMRAIFRYAGATERPTPG
jgi:hypothetical protein